MVKLGAGRGGLRCFGRPLNEMMQSTVVALRARMHVRALMVIDHVLWAIHVLCVIVPVILCNAHVARGIDYVMPSISLSDW